MENDNNIDDLIRAVTPIYQLRPEHEEEVMRLAAVGLNAKDIAIALELSPSDNAAFCAAAAIPGSSVNHAIEIGRVNGYAQPMIKLQEAASIGNIEAVRELNKSQRRGTFTNIIRNMDDDEIAL